MLVNLSDVLTSEGKTIRQEVSIEMDVFKSRMGEYPILEKSPVSFTFENRGTNKANIKGNAEIVLDMNCDRCLKEMPVKVQLDFEREVSVAEEREDAEEDDDQDVMEGYQLNVEVLIYNEILMNQPEKVLCQPECKGICKVCGKDLNDGECGCDTFVPDPRMAVLQDIFNANKEV